MRIECAVCGEKKRVVVMNEMYRYPFGKKTDFRVERKHIELECGHCFVGEWCDGVQDMRRVALVYVGDTSSVEVGDWVMCDLRELSENSE
jgi:hypothetical protein